MSLLSGSSWILNLLLLYANTESVVIVLQRFLSFRAVLEVEVISILKSNFSHKMLAYKPHFGSVATLNNEDRIGTGINPPSTNWMQVTDFLMLKKHCGEGGLLGNRMHIHKHVGHVHAHARSTVLYAQCKEFLETKHQKYVYHDHCYKSVHIS